MIGKNSKVVYVIFLTLFNIIISLLFNSLYLFMLSSLLCLIFYFVADKLFDNVFSIYNSIFVIWIVGVVFAAILYLVYIKIYGQPYWMSGMDDYNFDVIWSDEVINRGYFRISQMLKNRMFWVGNANGYIMLLANLKRIGGASYSTMIPRVINVGLLIINSLLIGSYIHKHTNLPEKKIGNMILIMGVFPNTIFLVSHVYRDQICAFFFVLIFFLWSDFFEKKLKIKISIAIVTVFVMYWSYWFRATNVVYILGIIALSIYNKDSWSLILKRKYSRSSIFIVIFSIIFIPWLISKNLERLKNWIVQYNYFSRGMLDIGDLQGIIYGISLFPFGWLIRILYYLVNPFETECINLFNCENGLSYINTFRTYGTFFLLFLYPYLFKAIKKCNNMVLIFLGIMMSSALTTAGFRHMITFYPFMFALAILEFYETTNYTKKLFFLISCLLNMALIGMALF